MTDEQRRVRELSEFLRTLGPSPEPVLELAMGELRELLGAEWSHAYRVSRAATAWTLDFSVTAGRPIASLPDKLRDFFARAPETFARYDPVRPEPDQRNVARLHDWDAIRRVPLSELLTELGLAGCSQVRVLVCEGPRLLACVGGLRPEPFGRREASVLEQLVPALRDRLSLDLRFGEAALRADALSAALEAIGAPAFVVSMDGRVQSANAAGRAIASRDDAALTGMLRASLAGHHQSPSIMLTRLSSPGMPALALAVLKPTRSTREALARAASAWGLTERQAEVLDLVVRGKLNKEIADELRCSERTVEAHLTSLFRKAGVHNRAELVSLFWSER